MKTVSLSISIATSNHRDLLATCLDSIYQATLATSFEVAVVDSGSTDGTLAMLLERFPAVRVIESPEFSGYGRSHNQAMRQRNGRYALILNDDMRVLPGSIDSMVRFMDEHPRAGILGCQLLDPDGTVQPSSYLTFSCLWTEVLRSPGLRRLVGDIRRRLQPGAGVCDYYGRQNLEYTRASRVAHLMGACLLVRGEVIEQVGLFDEGFFLSFEDQDWCKRIGEAGWEVIFFPAAKMVHFGGQTVRLLSDRFAPIFLASRLYFQSKHFSRFSLLQLRLFWTLVVVARMGLSLISRLAFRCRDLRAAWRRQARLLGIAWSRVGEVPHGA